MPMGDSVKQTVVLRKVRGESCTLKASHEAVRRNIGQGGKAKESALSYAIGSLIVGMYVCNFGCGL